MKRLFILLGLVMSLSIPALAQDTEEKKEEEVTPHWETGGLGTLNINQTGLWNWAQGGVNNVTGTAYLNLFANKKMPKAYWDNSLDLAYGLVYQHPQNEPNTFIKGDDKIDLLSKWGMNTGNEHWFYSANFNFRSQFAPGYVSAVARDTGAYFLSRFMAPSFTTLALGMEYKPNKKLDVFLSPLTGKLTTVFDDSLSARGDYGVIAGESLRWELGASARVKFKDEIMKNVNYETQFDLFANYLAKNQYDNKFPDGSTIITNPEFSPLAYFDVNWTNSILMKVNKYITVSLFTHLFYDWDVRLPGEEIDNNGIDGDGRPNARLRFKEVSGVGFSYKFGSTDAEKK